MSDTTNLPPAGWYPDSNGDRRWWDGTAWTERLEVEGPPAPVEAVTVPLSQASSAASAGSPTVQPRPRAHPMFYTTKWFVGAAAGVLGLIIGIAAGGSADPKSSDEYKAVSSKLAETKASLADTESELSATKEVAARVDQVDEREDGLDQREASIKDSESRIKREDKNLRKREKAVGIVEKDIESNTISNGVYEVGVDMKPGRYKTAGPSDGDVPFCSYRVSSDEAGENIITIENVQGPGIVSVAKGQYFFSQLCKDWTLQR